MKFVLVSIVMLISTNSLLAVEADASDNVSMETMVVKASRLQQNIYEIGSSVDVIASEDIEALGYSYVIDALASVSGVTINQNGSFGGRGGVRIRGASSAQTLVLIDGVPVNDASSPGGGFDFARLDPTVVERIEILKGPHSTLWGSDAIGGVVSIETKQPEGPLGGNIFLEYGAHDTFRGGAELSNANEVGDFRFSVSTTESDGISKADEDNGNPEDDAFESTTYALRGGLNLHGESRLNLSVLSTEADTEFDGFSFGAQGSVGDADERSETDELLAQANLIIPSFDGRLLSTFTVGYSDIERDNVSNGVPSFSAEGERQIYRYQGRFDINETNQLGFGVEQEQSEAEDIDNDVTGTYLLYEWQALDALTLTFGMRADESDHFDREVTGRAGIAYQLNDNVTLRGSWGEGFKIPTLFQTTFFCCGAAAPNVDLQPEEADAFDMGIDWRSADGLSDISVTYFQQDIENLITFSFAAGGYENIAKAESEGVEISFGHQFATWFGVSGSYAYIDAIDEFGQALIGVPEHSGDLQINFAPTQALKFNVLVRYNGDEEDAGGIVAHWTRVDVAGRYAITENLQLFARIENLLDEEYQQILGYGTQGTSFSGGLRMQF